MPITKVSQKSRNCGLLLCVAVALVISGMEAVQPKSVHPSHQPSGVCDLSHQTFLSAQSFVPRIVGPYYFQTFPEAQYQDEFYCCCFDLTTGSLTTLSDFGTADTGESTSTFYPKMGNQAPMRRTTPRTTQQSFFLWNDSRH